MKLCSKSKLHPNANNIGIKSPTQIKLKIFLQCYLCLSQFSKSNLSTQNRMQDMNKLTTHSFVMKIMLQTKVTSQLASHNNPATNAKFQKHGTNKLRFQPGLARSRFCVRGGPKNWTEEFKWSKNLELNWTGLYELDSSKNLTQQVYMQLDPAQNWTKQVLRALL